MKVVHAICTHGFGGVERHVAVLAAAEHDAGHDVVVVGGDQGRMLQAIDRPGVRRIAASGVGDVAFALSKQVNADVFNLHMTAAEIAAAMAIPARHVPAVATRHFAARRGQSSRLAQVVATQAARRISQQIAVSSFVAQHIEPPSVVVVSGVTCRPEARTANTRDKSVLVAQRLEAEKRTEDAVRIFAAARLADVGWTLDVAGTGSQRPRLDRIVRQLGLESAVRFLSHRDDVHDLMDRSSLLIGPGTVEALGLTVLEAMAHGLPAVAAGAGGHLETVGSACPDLLYPPGDLHAAARLLRRLADNPSARDQFGRALQAAQRREFSIDAQAAATEAVYRSVQ